MASVFVSKKKMMPIVYHVFEFCVYLTICHYVLWLAVVAINYFADATNPGSLHGYKTPGSILYQNFADKALYSPVALFYTEMAIVLALMYVVIVVRPTSYSTKNRYKGDSDRGMESKRGRGAPRYDRARASGDRHK